MKVDRGKKQMGKWRREEGKKKKELRKRKLENKGQMKNNVKHEK